MQVSGLQVFSFSPAAAHLWSSCSTSCVAPSQQGEQPDAPKALDCCTSAVPTAFPGYFGAVSPPSITHTAFAESQTHMDAVRSPIPFCLLQELSIWLSISSFLFLKCFGITPLPAGPRLDLLATLEISSKALNWQQKERQRLLGTVSNWARHTVGRGCNPSPGMPL